MYPFSLFFFLMLLESSFPPEEIWGWGRRINQWNPKQKMNIPHFCSEKLSLQLRPGECLRRLRKILILALILTGAKPAYCPFCSSSQGASEFFLCSKQLTEFSWSGFDTDRAKYVKQKRKEVGQRLEWLYQFSPYGCSTWKVCSLSKKNSIYWVPLPWTYQWPHVPLIKRTGRTT